MGWGAGIFAQGRSIGRSIVATIVVRVRLSVAFILIVFSASKGHFTGAYILAISHEFDLNDNNAWPAGTVCALPGNIKILDGVCESECECYTSFLASGVYLRKTNHFCKEWSEEKGGEEKPFGFSKTPSTGCRSSILVFVLEKHAEGTLNMERWDKDVFPSTVTLS
ncbi:hypothetical protein KQX54_019412 [Cotesia glomerata]|uniref:Uncharacterized protein n=1 Tax=Cotesia glomerata TaxID=32391 RepID=A0AAV7J8Q4_COTGL|nr:hypothetical protein KQX54_019412 [Cotesia glomerata]